MALRKEHGRPCRRRTTLLAGVDAPAGRLFAPATPDGAHDLADTLGAGLRSTTARPRTTKAMHDPSRSALAPACQGQHPADHFGVTLTARPQPSPTAAVTERRLFIDSREPSRCLAGSTEHAARGRSYRVRVGAARPPVYRHAASPRSRQLLVRSPAAASCRPRGRVQRAALPVSNGVGGRCQDRYGLRLCGRSGRLPATGSPTPTHTIFIELKEQPWSTGIGSLGPKPVIRPG
jgi:hypothetical protein